MLILERGIDEKIVSLLDGKLMCEIKVAMIFGGDRVRLDITRTNATKKRVFLRQEDHYAIHIDYERSIDLMITKICDDKVKFGFTAPQAIKIYRKEVYLAILREKELESREGN